MNYKNLKINSKKPKTQTIKFLIEIKNVSIVRMQINYCIKKKNPKK